MGNIKTSPPEHLIHAMALNAELLQIWLLLIFEPIILLNDYYHVALEAYLIRLLCCGTDVFEKPVDLVSYYLLILNHFKPILTTPTIQ